MRQEEVKELLKKYNAGTANAEQKALVEAWYEQYESDEQILNEAHMQLIEDEVFSRLPIGRQIPVRRMWPRIAAAASILAFLSFGGYFVLHKKQFAPQTAQRINNDIAPGHNQATLTLANGKKITLTRGLAGLIAQQGKTNINATDNTITYTSSKKADQISYNTMTTARGEQSPYPLVLSDGTKVWLNAASSIKFPTAFTGNERVVTVTGEAYVIVAHNAKMPFKLIAGGQTINDVGTEFNINAYDDEPVVTTTLAEGSIKISKNEQSTLVKPGQQSITKVNSNTITVRAANLESALAWKSGKFDFDNADVPSVMRQIARWYNVDVEYENGIPNASINGALFRNTNAGNALKIVKLLGIPYRIEGRKIIITNIK